MPDGACIGLLGPNGAGKSTTMRMLTAQAIADRGELEVLGHRLPEESKSARALMGVVPQLDNLDTTLTVQQNLVVFTHLYRVPRAQRRAAIDRALDAAGTRTRGRRASPPAAYPAAYAADGGRTGTHPVLAPALPLIERANRRGRGIPLYLSEPAARLYDVAPGAPFALPIGAAGTRVDAYVAGGEGLGKAGGYGVQGYAEAFVRFLSGSHSGVIGLPLFETRALLTTAGVLG